MSSMGDVVHNLPLVADILHAHPEAQIDWVVEEAYADLVRLHPGVRRVLPIALRRWRRQLFQPGTLREMRTFWRELRSQSYDAILDTQSLLKSALVCRAARGLRVGYVAAACKEPIAACCYQKRLPYPPVKAVHAVQRYRDLSAWATASIHRRIMGCVVPSYWPPLAGVRAQHAMPCWCIRPPAPANCGASRIGKR
jgi:heptosyltransferase-1